MATCLELSCNYDWNHLQPSALQMLYCLCKLGSWLACSNTSLNVTLTQLQQLLQATFEGLQFDTALASPVSSNMCQNMLAGSCDTFTYLSSHPLEIICMLTRIYASKPMLYLHWGPLLNFALQVQTLVSTYVAPRSAKQ